VFPFSAVLDFIYDALALFDLSFNPVSGSGAH
jgi:hypothetical protein